LATAPLYTPKFRYLFAACWLLWTALHGRVLVWFGFSIRQAVADSLISNALLMASCILVTVIFRFYLPKTHRYSFLFGICFILTTIWTLLSQTILYLAIPGDDYEAFFTISIPVRMAIAFLVIGCMTLISVLWYTLQDQQEIEKRKNSAEQMAKEAELYNLRQQLQPHFLFNSLNSINALVALEPARARNMIQQLSDFLRGTLKKEARQWVSLQEELEHLRLYLEIEKVRFGHRLHTHIIKGTDKELKLPAMILQPVVENAIKFGLYDTTDAVTINLEAQFNENYLVLIVSNPFDPQTSDPNKGTGFGLRSVKRRLYLLFARNDLLQTNVINNQFITIIKIPQHDQGNHN
jgi:hypothetical protein